jgi:class 3 adenylate cyclase
VGRFRKTEKGSSERESRPLRQSFYTIEFPISHREHRAAVKILQNAEGYNKDAPEKERIELRVGISYGELALDEQRERHGAAINKAFRIEGLKKEDQQSMGGGLEPEDFPEKNRIFVSEETKEEIKDVPEIPVHQVGVFDLKGFTGLHRIYCIPWRDVLSD